MKPEIFSERERCRMGSNHLGIILTDFGDHLQSLGYAPWTVRDYVNTADHFGRWLKTRHVGATEITQEVIRSFLRKHLPRCHCQKPASKVPDSSASALQRLFEMLQAQGIVAPRSAIAMSPMEQIVARFDRYLLEVCGAAETTRRTRRGAAMDLLVWRFGNRALRLQQISARDLERFVAFRSKALQPLSIRLLSDSLRSFLRFLQFEDLCQPHLDLAVPTVHVWNRAHLPTVIDEGKLKQFLRSYDRSTPMGRRDYAMALCMSELGLRASEVAQLSLGDLDWHHHILKLPQNKQRRARQLPLPDRLAQAIADYLHQGRPSSLHRQVFLRHQTPAGKPLYAGTVRWAMRRGYDRVGIKAKGTHLLRRTFATRLHRRGANIKLIADFLGHNDLGTAAVYARVNLKQLRLVALPWPD